MKHVKILGTLLIISAALMALAVTASADSVTSPTGTSYTSELNAAAEGHVVLDNPIWKLECTSTVAGKVEGHGVGIPASGNISSLIFTNCTNDWHVTVVSAGSLSVKGIEGSYNGEVIASGATVETTRFGISCRYLTNSTKIGLLTGGSPGTMHIQSSIPFHSGSFLCGSGATTWTGSYKVASPNSLYVDKN